MDAGGYATLKTLSAAPSDRRQPGSARLRRRGLVCGALAAVAGGMGAPAARAQVWREDVAQGVWSPVVASNDVVMFAQDTPQPPARRRGRVKADVRTLWVRYEYRYDQRNQPADRTVMSEVFFEQFDCIARLSRPVQIIQYEGRNMSGLDSRQIDPAFTDWVHPAPDGYDARALQVACRADAKP